MAGFCTKCGSPLEDAQAFCARCGTPAGGPPVRPSAAAPPPTSNAPSVPPIQTAQSGLPSLTPVPAPQAAAASAKSGSRLVNVLLVFAVVIFVFGAIGAVGIWYVVHKAKQKFHEIGLDELSDASKATRGPVLPGIDPCSLLSEADVGQSANVEVVRAEATEGSEPGCVYNVQGDGSDLVAKHASLIHKEAATDAERQQLEAFSKNFSRGMQGQKGFASRHPGEAPVFLFSISNAAAKAQMNLTRMAFSHMAGGMTTINGLGDEAIDIGSGMMLVRKDDKIIRVMYMMCPCTTNDVTPLVRKILTNM
jgi:zinc-ribbon domain